MTPRPLCEAKIPYLRVPEGGLDFATCESQAVALDDWQCACGAHTIRRWTCGGHRFGEGGCLQCFQAGHECALLVRKARVPGAPAGPGLKPDPIPRAGASW